MSRTKFNWSVIRDPSWLHWAVTVPLLACHVAALDGCLLAAITMCLAVAGAMWLKLRRLLAMPVQVRLAYVALLASGVLPGMFWIYLVQLAGTTAVVLVGYCPLVRMLTLLPWNRNEPINRDWLKRLVFSTAPGGLVDWPEQTMAAATCSCSFPPALPRQDATRSR